MRSAIEVSGVASFSPKRRSRCTHSIGVSSPRSATSTRACEEIGWYGSSLISLPATIGSHSSSKFTSDRMMRVFACPRSPSRMMSWLASNAFASCGRTVSS
jgi:hypothetical protein